MLRLARQPTWTRLARICSRRRMVTHAHPPTEIEKLMLDSVKATGPLSFATYMQLCLSHPVHGYYMNPSNSVFGPKGDFITNPEISQVYGELVAIWLIERWKAAGANVPFRIVELGPGRGTLMSDMLRIMRHFPLIRSKLHSVHLVETSPSMRTLQHTALRTVEEQGIVFTWHDGLDQIARHDDVFTMIVAHEFFDALPVHVIEKTAQGWHEVLISPAASLSLIRRQDQITRGSPPLGQPRPARWTPVLSSSPTAPSVLLGHISPRFASLPVGARIEVSHLAFKIARQIAELITTSLPKESSSENASAGGCALIIDYGDEHADGDSLRAFKQHAMVDIFHLPGECDLTANVDFALLKEAFSDLVTTHGTVPQHKFLKDMGIDLRAEQLKAAAPTDERRQGIAQSVGRLVDPVMMGRHYNILGVTGAPKGEPVWPFFPTK